MSISNQMKEAMTRSSWIRQMFEEGTRLKALYGAEQVFDFSLGNPILEPPAAVHRVLLDLLSKPPQGMHRYMPNAGYPETREAIAKTLTREMPYLFKKEDIIMCVGAGGGLNAVFKALLNPGEKVLALAPYFVEYGFYAQNHNGTLIVANTNDEFQPDWDEIEKTLTPDTKIMIINSPNNPTGVVYSQQTLNQLGELLAKKEKAYGHAIYLISDEPYRQILFDHVELAHVFIAHKNSIMVTSHSKDLGLAGERIGYIAIHPEIEIRNDLQNALVLTTRILGYVNAPALMQQALTHLQGVMIDISHYEVLRDLLYARLIELGFKVVKPQGAFYMFPQAPIADDLRFVKEALEEKVLLVPGTGFGKPGYFRIAYCCEQRVIERSFDRFEKLAKRHGLC
ncbi:pyridoxal phosphate-dependent aminotransferase [Deltaproteobacteria bacterium TL4]